MVRKSEQIFFVEGECEINFVKDLCQKGYINLAGKIEKFNICYHHVDKMIRKYEKINKHIDFYFIFDIDVLETNANKEQMTFSENWKKLKNIKQNKYCVIQVKNLYDELVYSCGHLNKKLDLFQLFDTDSENEFKENFINQNNRLEKLDSKGFDISKLWCQKTPSVLSQYKIERKQGANFQSFFNRKTKLV